MVNRFDEFWKLHIKIGKDLFIKDICSLKTVDVFLSDIPGPYFNYSVPKVFNPRGLDFSEIKTYGIYLSEENEHYGFTDYLIRKEYKFKGTDAWMILEEDFVPAETTADVDVRSITSESFSDFRSVLSEVFKDFSGNEKYLEMCQNSLAGGGINSVVSDLQSEFFVIYEAGRPVAGGGLISSVKENIAYLHNGGTLVGSRGKGYQSLLIDYRVQKALTNNITRIYSIAELGSQSWHNLIRHGFNQHQVAFVLARASEERRKQTTAD